MPTAVFNFVYGANPGPLLLNDLADEFAFIYANRFAGGKHAFRPPLLRPQPST
jgi:hypothetical protein